MIFLTKRKRFPNANDDEFAFPQIAPTKSDDSSVPPILTSVQSSTQQNIDFMEPKTVRITMNMHYRSSKSYCFDLPAHGVLVASCSRKSQKQNCTDHGRNPCRYADL